MTDGMPFDLETELRGSVPHFKVGQHRAFVSESERDAAILIYVGNLGWAVVMPCERHGAAGWKHCGIALSVSCNGPRTGWRPIKQEFQLSEAMCAALNAPTIVSDDDDVIAKAQTGEAVVDREQRF